MIFCGSLPLEAMCRAISKPKGDYMTWPRDTWLRILRTTFNEDISYGICVLDYHIMISASLEHLYVIQTVVNFLWPNMNLVWIFRERIHQVFVSDEDF